MPRRVTLTDRQREALLHLPAPVHYQDTDSR